MAEIAATDLVIATRFHNVLKALRLGRPVISIGYASKNDDLMRAMGLGEYCHGVDDFDPARVLAQVRDMAAFPAPPTETARAQVAKYQQALAAQFDQIAASAVRLKTGSRRLTSTWSRDSTSCRKPVAKGPAGPENKG